MQDEIFSRGRFLIVDDEVANVAVLTQMLEQWNATNVVSTTRSSAALPLFLSYRPDIVLLDLMMPGLDGFGVMRQLQPLIGDDDFVPILVLTADPTAQTMRLALDGGATDFLTKPFDATELSLRIRNLLARRFLHLKLQVHNRALDDEVKERSQQLARAELDTVECLALAAEYRDDDTGRHTQRVGRTAELLARAVGMDDQHACLVGRAAPLHDVGKIGISDDILLKPGKLSLDEFSFMKTHAAIGADIMARHRTPLLQLAANIARTHHERWDGTGYPNGLKAEETPIEGRLVAVADVFDALTHERPYKPAWSVDDAIAEIARQRCQQFDPLVVEVFLRANHYELL